MAKKDNTELKTAITVATSPLWVPIALVTGAFQGVGEG